MESLSLPQELRNFFVWFNTNPGAEKISFGVGNDGDHYTIRFWSRKRYLDLHVTNEKTGKRKTIFEISYYGVFRLLVKLQKIQPILLRKYLRRINLGKLKHHNCILFAHNLNEDSLKDFVLIKKGRIKFRKNADLEGLSKFFIEPDQIHTSNAEIFQVYKVKKGRILRQGFLYKTENNKITNRFIFFTKRNFAGYNRQLAIVMFNLLKQREFLNKDEILRLMYEKLTSKRQSPKARQS